MTLPPCPNSPNCVSSLASSEKQKVDPFPVQSNGPASLARLVRIINAMPRTKVVEQSPTQIKATFRTLIGFVDDLAFEVREQEDFIDVRSASRLGYSDLGLNRRRVEKIRNRYEKMNSNS